MLTPLENELLIALRKAEGFMPSTNAYDLHSGLRGEIWEAIKHAEQKEMEP